MMISKILGMPQGPLLQRGLQVLLLLTPAYQVWVVIHHNPDQV